MWPPASLEDTVQKLVKTWEMEMFNKLDSDDFRAVDADKYRFSLNGIYIIIYSRMNIYI